MNLTEQNIGHLLGDPVMCLAFAISLYIFLRLSLRNEVLVLEEVRDR